MPAITTLKQKILTECEEDHVGLWSVIRDAEDSLPKMSKAAIRDQVLGVLRELLIAREIKAGFPTEEGGFRALRIAPDSVLKRIEREWPVGQRPTIGEGLWFTKTKTTGRNLKSYIAKYGEVEGRKMYERLQKEAGLASAHAGHKKQLQERASS
jgi:hypothetical protein